MKRGEISSLKGLTKIFVSDSSGSKAVADYLRANTDGLIFVDDWRDANFSVHVGPGITFTDSFNSAPRLAPPNKIIADIEGPFAKHPGDVNASHVIGQAVGLTVTRHDSSDQRVLVWSKSVTSPVSRFNTPAYTTTSQNTTLDSSLSGARMSLVSDFLKAYKKIK